MSTEELMIATLQSRVQYLEAHLHLALQVLGQIEKDSQEYIQKLEFQSKNQVIDIVPSDKVELPNFLNSRTWKYNLEMLDMSDSRDLLFAKAS